MSGRPDPRAEPSSALLLALARKYRTLAELRRAKARGEPGPPRSVFRDLAAEFPGALYELDRLPLEDIDARIAALEAAASRPAEAAPWMRWMIAHDRVFRAALLVKHRLQGAREVSDERADVLAREASGATGFQADAAFVRAIARPPAGRLAKIVFAIVAVELGVDEATVRAAIRAPRQR